MAQRLTAQQKVRRDREIVQDRARGLQWATVAERHLLSERQAQAVWNEWRATRELPDEDTLAHAKEALVQIEAVIEDCALLAESTKNDSVQLGAIKTRLSALMQRFVLMQAIGALPRDIGVLAEQAESSQVSKATLRVFDEFGVSSEARLAIADLLTPGSQTAQNGAASSR